MCVQRRYIQNALGMKMVVNCGHCPSCLQSKAIQRANKIRANFPSDNSDKIVAYFVTLTYSNSFVPYIDKDEIARNTYYFKEVESNRNAKGCGSSRGDWFLDVDIYRDCTVRRVPSRVRADGTVKFVPKYTFKRHVLSSVPVLAADLQGSFSLLKRLKGQSCNKVGVIFYPDVQGFLSRFRLNLSRSGYDKSISYFACAEYGPSTCRPHFHLLIFAPSSAFELLSSSIVKAWPYDDGYRTKANIEIARNASSYVSSYVNCSSYIPSLFQNTSSFRPHSTTSHGFGMALDSFSLDKVFQAFRSGNLECSVWRYKDKSLILDTIRVPKYVINRYAPKFKGYSRLNADEVKSLCKDPWLFRSYELQQKLDYNSEDYEPNFRLLYRCRKMFLDAGYSLEDFADFYSSVWSLRSCLTYRDSFDDVVLPYQNFYAYDNIADYYSSSVLSDSLDDVFVHLPSNFHYVTDINNFPQIISKTDYLTSLYHSYSKDKKVRSMAFSYLHI